MLDWSNHWIDSLTLVSWSHFASRNDTLAKLVHLVDSHGRETLEGFQFPSPRVFDISFPFYCVNSTMSYCEAIFISPPQWGHLGNGSRGLSALNSFLMKSCFASASKTSRVSSSLCSKPQVLHTRITPNDSSPPYIRCRWIGGSPSKAKDNYRSHDKSMQTHGPMSPKGCRFAKNERIVDRKVSWAIRIGLSDWGRSATSCRRALQ